MTTSAIFVVGNDDLAAFQRIRDLAWQRPVDIKALIVSFKDPQRRQLHLDRMHEQTVRLVGGPFPFFVTYSIERGHPMGTCHHLSMSIDRPGRIPHPAAIEMVLPRFGFTGGIEDCIVYPEALSGGGTAINVLQAMQSTEGREPTDGHA